MLGVTVEGLISNISKYACGFIGVESLCSVLGVSIDLTYQNMLVDLLKHFVFN